MEVETHPAPPPLPTFRNGSNPKNTSTKPRRAAHTTSSPNLTESYTNLQCRATMGQKPQFLIHRRYYKEQSSSSGKKKETKANVVHIIVTMYTTK